MRSSGARFEATQAANIRYNASYLKKNLVLSFSDPGKFRLLYASFVSLIFQAVGLTVIMLTKVMCLANVIFGQERLTEQFLSMRFFYESIILFAKRCSLTSLSMLSFCESILFVHLKALRDGELRLVRTVGMVRLEIFIETLRKKWH